MKRIFLLLLSLIMIIGNISGVNTVFAQENTLPEAVNVTVNAFDSGAIISWRNPASDLGGSVYESIVLYDYNETVISDEFSTEADAANCYKIENLINGKVYSYTLEFTSENGIKKRVIIAVKPEIPVGAQPDIMEGVDGYYIDTESALYNDAAGMIFDNETFCPQKDEKGNNSTASIKFWGNNPDGTVKSYTTLKVTPGAFYTDCKYLLRFWAKSENGGGIVRFNGIEENDIVIDDNSNEWVKYEKIVSPVSDENEDRTDIEIEFFMNTDSKGVWIDNIEIFDCDNNLEPYFGYEYLNEKIRGNSANNSEHSPEEMIKKGTDDFKDVVSVSTASYQGMGELAFEWDEQFNGSIPLDIVKEIRIYETSNEESLVAIIPYGMNSIEINNLTNGLIYKYRFDVFRGFGKSVLVKNDDVFELSPEKIDYSKYEPENVMINGEDAKVTVSWRNPKEADAGFKTLRKIELYRIEDDSLTLLADDFSIDNKAACEYTDSNLKNAVTYSYKLSFVYENARPLDLYLAAMTDKSAKTLGAGTSSWNVGTAIGANEFTVDKTEAYGEGSTASLKFTSNATKRSQFMAVSDIPYQDIRFTAGTKYRIEYDSKAINSGAGIFLIGGWDYVHYMTGGTFDWRHFSQDFEVTKNVSGFFFKPTVPGDTVWIDNLGIYELNEKNEKVGSNMIEKFSAENLYADSIPQTITADVTEDDIIVNWENTESIDIMKIYVQTENGTFLRAIAPVSAKGTQIGGLDYSECTLVAKSVVGGIESESTSVTTVVPQAKKYEISEYILTSANGEVKEVSDAGDYSLEVSLKNNYAGNDFTAQLFVVQFNEKGQIIAADGSGAVRVYETDVNDYSPENFLVEFKVKPETKKVTAYLWNSLDSMEEIIESRNFK